MSGTENATARLAALARFDGPIEAFWSGYLQQVGQALRARRVVLLSAAVGKPWQARGQWPAQGGEHAQDPAWVARLLSTARPEVGPVWHPATPDQGAALLLWPVTGAPGAPVLALLALDVSVEGDGQALAWLSWATLVAAIPAQWAHQGATAPAPAETPPTPSLPPDEPSATVQALTERAQRLHALLRTGIQLGQENHFVALAMGLCNELALRFGADRVSLGEVDGHYVRLKAISHVEFFDGKSQASRALEQAMEEAMAQEAVLQYPAMDGAPPHVLRAHQNYAEVAQQNGHLSTWPVLHGQTPVVVLCLERKQGPLSVQEVWEAQLLTDSLARWLWRLQRQDRWWGARARDGLRQAWQALGQPRHTLWKLGGAAAGVLLLALATLSWPYRVDATLAVRSQDLLFMPAPFDGYLRQVKVHVGDAVGRDTVLVELDTRDLALEASMADADRVRYQREAEKALAAAQLAEMQIAAARAQQAAARLEMIHYQLEHAQVRAPYDGVVVEGDLQKNLGAPVRKGDLLLKLAKTEDAYIELEIDQIHVQDVQVGTQGEFALVGRPEERYPITVTRIDPAAVTRDGRTFYVARARLDTATQPNWRPGMGGNAKLEAGLRSPLWIMTHRTVRFLREFFWL